MGVREKARFLEQWRMDATDLRRRRPLAICAWGAGRRCRACPGVGRGEGRQIPGRAVQP